MIRLTLLLVALFVSEPLGQAWADESRQPLHNANPANPLFECGQKTIGQVACQAGNRCKCIYNAFGDAMRGLPPGYRWDCGLEQGSCLVDVPATTGGSEGAPPAAAPTPSPQVIAPYSGAPSGR